MSGRTREDAAVGFMKKIAEAGGKATRKQVGLAGREEDRARQWARSQGFVEYREGGWSLTPKGDAHLQDVANPRRPLMLDQRERDTIIAALRYWQHSLEGTQPDMLALIEISENGREGEDSRLLAEEIDELIEERVNA